MPTTAERQALLFLAAIAVIGSGVRAAGTHRFLRQVDAAERFGRAGTDSTATGRALGRPTTGAGETHAPEQGSAPLGDRALASQIAAVDSARAERKARATRGPAAPRTGVRSATTTRPSRQPSAPVDINRASAAELERLPRIGPALAERIIAWRTTNGPFRSIDDLRHVRGIGPATAALLAESVTF